jgi:hypothetical protein
MLWMIGIAVAVVLYWLIILRPGRLDFWKLVAKYPDSAYDHFCSNPCWVVFESEMPEHYRALVPNDEWDGPFRLWVPKLGGAGIYVFGHKPDYERLQDEFVQQFGGRR